MKKNKWLKNLNTGDRVAMWHSTSEEEKIVSIGVVEKITKKEIQVLMTDDNDKQYRANFFADSGYSTHEGHTYAIRQYTKQTQKRDDISCLGTMIVEGIGAWLNGVQRDGCEIAEMVEVFAAVRETKWWQANVSDDNGAEKEYEALVLRVTKCQSVDKEAA